ncbi:hypothetical protein J437_LFUL005062 [Ladona fulva]|uniref:Transcription termination factor 2 n=1 Tax=Ladona fulva TaxID=123851 RepID=A0A8K0KQ73_LADFU|nr:hypothetical protein J437_LFUL005062 [Ladona fulva]
MRKFIHVPLYFTEDNFLMKKETSRYLIGERKLNVKNDLSKQNELEETMPEVITLDDSMSSVASDSETYNLNDSLATPVQVKRRCNIKTPLKESLSPNEVIELKTHSTIKSSTSSSSLKEESPCLSEQQKMAMRIEDLTEDIKKKKMVMKTVDPATLPDRGIRLQMAVTSLEKDLKALRLLYERKFCNEVEIIEPQIPFLDSQNLPTKGEGTSNNGIFNNNSIGVTRGMDSVTMDALKNLHDSLKTLPAENVMAEQPEGLKISLMPHQSHGLAWMLWREQQTPPGGILADDMGLGKTLSMISLILKHKEDLENNINAVSESNDDPKGGTLVVCPTSLLGQWKTEVERRCKKYALSVYVYHGSDRSSKPRSLMRHDVVLTTYGIVMRECESISTKGASKKQDGPIHLVNWTRIILDEAHVVRNCKSKTSQAVICLKGTYRWALTGTPIHNKELDLFALIVFLRCSPFDRILVWRRWVDNKTAAGAQRMNMLMKSLMLRRTKDQLKTKGSLTCLPSREEHYTKIDLDNLEQMVYDQILVLTR